MVGRGWWGPGGAMGGGKWGSRGGSNLFKFL